MPLALEGPTPLLEVFDLPTSIAFYCGILGFELVSGDDQWWCMLKLGGSTLMLNTAYDDDERPATVETGRVRGHGDVSLYFGADPDEVHALLVAKGWDVSEPAITSYGMRQVNTRDPDEFRLCFTSPARM